MTTPIDTKALRELEAKATEGRWHVLREGPGEINVYPEAWRGKPNVERYALIARFSPWDGASQDDRDEVMAQANANVALIVALRNAAPALLDLAERAQEQAKQNEELRAIIGENASAAADRIRAALRGQAERDALKAEVERLREAQTYLDVVFDGPPSHESGRFVEVENLEGFSVGAGEWINRGNGFWALRLPVLRAALRGEEAPRGE